MFKTQDERGMNSAFRKSYQALKSSHSKAFGIEKGRFVDAVDKQNILTKFLRSPEKYIPKERQIEPSMSQCIRHNANMLRFEDQISLLTNQFEAASPNQCA